VDRVLLVHALEMSHDVTGLLREVWRGLSGSGRPMAVVPNRRGLRARTPTTPFGHGPAYSRPPTTPPLPGTRLTPASSRPAVHAGSGGRGAIGAAGLARLVPARRRGLGAHRRDDLGAVRRRAHRGGDQAGLSRDPGAAREAQARACAGARARAHAVNRPSRLR